MSKGNRSKPAPPRGKGPRTARLGELLREVVAEELERIDDRAPGAGQHHVGRGRRRPQPGHRLVRLAGRRGRRRRDPRGLCGRGGSGCRPRSAGRSTPGRRPCCSSARTRSSATPSASSRSSGTRPATPARRPARARTARARTPPGRTAVPGQARRRRPTLARRRPPVLHGLLVVDKPAGATSHDVVAQLRRRLGERRMGHSGHARPRRHRRAARRRRLADPGAALPDRPAQDVHGRGRPRRRDLDPRRLRRGHRPPRHGRDHDRRRPRCGGRAPHGHGRPGPADGLGPAGGRSPPARAGPGGRRGRAGGPAGDRPPVRRAARRRTRSSTASRSSARRGRTSGRSPRIWGTCSAAARTCATCAAPPSARSPRPRPLPPTRRSCCRRRRRCATTSGSSSTRTPRR